MFSAKLRAAKLSQLPFGFKFTRNFAEAEGYCATDDQGLNRLSALSSLGTSTLVNFIAGRDVIGLNRLSALSSLGTGEKVSVNDYYGLMSQSPFGFKFTRNTNEATMKVADIFMSQLPFGFKFTRNGIGPRLGIPVTFQVSIAFRL